MKHASLFEFLQKAASSDNRAIKKKADDILESLMANQEQEQVVAPEVQEESADSAVQNQKKDEVDARMMTAFPELTQSDGIDSSFGKAASAFVTDITINDLPKDTKEAITRLIPGFNPNAKVVQYGMVVDELLPKVDHHNYEAATDHIKKDFAKEGKRAMGDRFQDKIGKKYILLLNDCIVDGHHFLALADKLGITCSLRVLDLTPIRFQEKRGSLLSLIKQSQYGQSNNRGKGGISLPRYSRSTSVFRGKGTR